jgi:hypothetical protein
MRELEFLEKEDEISQDVFDTLLRYPHSEPLCPRLLTLSWAVDPVFGADFVHFLSPQLRQVHLTSRPGTVFSFPHAISSLPSSSLTSLRLSITGDEPVRRAIASLFSECPQGLTTLEVQRMDQLQDDTWSRIMLLPLLRSLETDQLPPTRFPHSLPISFPVLRGASFRGHAASRWIRFLSENNGRGFSSGAGSQPRMVAPRLSQLHCNSVGELDSTLVSYFRAFRELSTLRLAYSCTHAACAFHLTDEDISRFATELPGLRRLSLGFPCARNSCATTVNSLLTLSTRCKGLCELRIHFNTRNFARDMKNTFHNPLRHNSRPPQRCKLAVLDVWLTPLTLEAVGGEVFPTLAGLVDIFPWLQEINFRQLSPLVPSGWQQLSAQLPVFQEMRRSLPAVFTQ